MSSTQEYVDQKIISPGKIGSRLASSFVGRKKRHARQQHRRIFISWWVIHVIIKSRYPAPSSKIQTPCRRMSRRIRLRKPTWASRLRTTRTTPRRRRRPRPFPISTARSTTRRIRKEVTQSHTIFSKLGRMSEMILSPWSPEQILLYEHRIIPQGVMKAKTRSRDEFTNDQYNSQGGRLRVAWR